MAEASLLVEIEDIFASGSAARQADVLRRVTDLFLEGVNRYADAQVDLFDGVILRLAARIETRARAELALRLAPLDKAPLATINALARDRSMEVAGPILQQSPRLSDDDLLDIAKDNDQSRLLAISQRAQISEKIGDALVTRGDREVVLSVARNEGARFSDTGYGRLVERSIDDEVLAVCVAMRKDVPREHFKSLVSKASQVVLEKLVAANPSAVAEVQAVLADITGQPASTEPSAAQVKARQNQAADAEVYRLATSGNVAATVKALAELCQAPSELVRTLLADSRGGNDLILLMARAANLSWPTAKQLCVMRRGETGLSALDLQNAQRNFERLQPETAQHVIRFYNKRHSAVSSFQDIEQKMRDKDPARTPRFRAAPPAGR